MVILVIDDEEAIRESLYDIITSAGHQATMAERGQEGLDYFEKGMYDLVITDLRMPEMDGWELAQAVRDRKPHTPVILPA